MAETDYKPVPHDAAFRKALLAKPGVKKAFDALKMEYTAPTQQNRLTPAPKALQKALEQSADQARRLADAFGVVVPYAKPRAARRKHNAS